MVNIRGAITGTHPLGEDLIQSILDYKYGRDSKEPVKEKFFKELSELLEFQEKLGFPNITTGNLGIEDIIRPFTRTLSSLKSYEELGDLPINRYHYTNTFYRSPSIVEELPENGTVLNTDEHSLTDENSFNHNDIAKNTNRLIIPGPVTFASMIDLPDDGPYDSYSAFIRESGRYLAEEIASLENKPSEIQLDEPYFVWERIPPTIRDDIVEAYQYIETATKQIDTIIHTYFESVDNIISFLLDLPVDGIGIDFHATNITSILDYDFSDKILQAGIIDAQNYVPDDNGDVSFAKKSAYVNLIQSLTNLSPKEIIIGSNTSLEYLPKELADQKLEQIAEIVNTTKEEL